MSRNFLPDAPADQRLERLSMGHEISESHSRATRARHTGMERRLFDIVTMELIEPLWQAIKKWILQERGTTSSPDSPTFALIVENGSMEEAVCVKLNSSNLKYNVQEFRETGTTARDVDPVKEGICRESTASGRP